MKVISLVTQNFSSQLERETYHSDLMGSLDLTLLYAFAYTYETVYNPQTQQTQYTYSCSIYQTTYPNTPTSISVVPLRNGMAETATLYATVGAGETLHWYSDAECNNEIGIGTALPINVGDVSSVKYCKAIDAAGDKSKVPGNVAYYVGTRPGACTSISASANPVNPGVAFNLRATADKPGNTISIYDSFTGGNCFFANLPSPCNQMIVGGIQVSTDYYFVSVGGDQLETRPRTKFTVVCN